MNQLHLTEPKHAGAVGAAPPSPTPTSPATVPVRRLRVSAVVLSGLGLAVFTAALHVAQGTADVGAGDLLRLVTGRGTDQAADVAIASRLPRVAAGILVGCTLGIAGAALQSVARNTLASPDTLGVNAGAYLAVTLAAAFGLSLPALPSGALAFIGGLLAAGLVLALSAGGESSPTRLVLAGSATAMGLSSLTTVLLLLRPYETAGLFAWGSGSLAQIGFQTVQQMALAGLVATAGLLVLARRLDLLSLGDDAARVLGVHVGRTRLATVLLAVLLSAAAVTVAGPIGFVGLCAPALVRLLAPAVPGLLHHRVLLPASAIAGVTVVLGADVVLRAAVGSGRAVEVPTGVVTSLLGATVLVILASRFRDSGPTRQAPAARSARLRTRRSFLVVLTVVAVATTTATVVGLLLGDQMLLAGDVWNWLADRSGIGVTFVLDTRSPRVLAALLAGAALALAGVLLQAICRNPLAEPGVIGVAAGAGVGGVVLITVVPLAGAWAVTGSALLGAAVATGLVFSLSVRGGLTSDRLVLVGVGVSAGAMAIIAFIIIASDPWNETKALTWLAGSTYGRTFGQLVPLALCLLVAVPLIFGARWELDLVALDDDTPQLLGIRLSPMRMLLLSAAAVLTATAVSAVGVIAFVGLVAPHAARALVGSRHWRVLPVAVLLGALLVSVADTVGRTALAPAQLPAGLVTALIGTPYFGWLLWRTRMVAAPS